MPKTQNSTVLLGPLHEFSCKVVDYSGEGNPSSRNAKNKSSTQRKASTKRSSKKHRQS